MLCITSSMRADGWTRSWSRSASQSLLQVTPATGRALDGGSRLSSSHSSHQDRAVWHRQPHAGTQSAAAFLYISCAMIQEDAFKLFRPFGVIVSLTTDKNTAVVTYASRKAAIRCTTHLCFSETLMHALPPASARNCLHNYILMPKPPVAPIPGVAPPPVSDQPTGRIRISYGEWQRFVRVNV